MEHERKFGRNKITFRFEHYLDGLARKPGAVRHGLPFQDDVLPQALVELRHHFQESYDDANRQFVDVLCAVSQFGLETIECACELTLATGVASADLVLNAASRLNDPPKDEVIVTREALQLSEEPSDDCGDYDQILSEKLDASA